MRASGAGATALLATAGEETTGLAAGNPPAGALEVCSVRVGQTLFGVALTHIVEIVGEAHPQMVPLAPEFVGGLVHYRGDVLTTVSLRRLFGMEPREGPQDMLVLEREDGCFGLLVDGVGEVLTVFAADHEPNPSVLDERRRSLFGGAYKLRDSLLVMLHPDTLDPARLELAGWGRPVASHAERREPSR